MPKAGTLTDLITEVSQESLKELDKFMALSEKRTGRPERAELRLLEALTATYQLRMSAH